MHLGLGAFHRAHQALVFDTLLQRGDPRWSVLGVAMRSTRWAEALQAQNGLYSVQISSAVERTWRICSAIRATCVAATERGRVVEAIAAPSTRWITLTVTEKGYTPALAELLVEGLARRHARSGTGLTIASCDNLAGNGRLLAALCHDAAAASPLMQRWMASACAFPNSMVDRIVPAATAQRREEAAQALGVDDEAALATEAFWEWVIEDRFADPADAAALRSTGVNVVDDVEPFEAAKLRLLNGSHSALACIGAVLGHATVADCLAQPPVRRFLHALMTDEVMPNLMRPALPAYRDALLERFANPHLAHGVHQIATDFSKKIPQRWVPSVLAQLKRRAPTAHLAVIAAAWVRYCLATDEAGDAYALNDPQCDALRAAARTHWGDDAVTVQALLTMPSIWGDVLPHEAAWLHRVTEALSGIRSQGLLTKLDRLHRA